MPLLKRKRYPLLQPPTYDPTKKDKERQVWYYRITNEVFEDYTTYLQRLTLYRRPVWQCEITGRSNLTYEDALKSEMIERDRVRDKLPENLQQRVLERVQFQTARLDSVVEDIYMYFLERYIADEIVNCIWDDKIAYNARILEVYPSEKQDSKNNISKNTTYKVQLIDNHLEGIEDCVKLVGKTELKRDRLSYSKNLLKKFIRRCATKETYMGAPWMVKTELSEKYGIDSKLPLKLQQAKDNAYSNSRKRNHLNHEDKTSKSESRMMDVKYLESIIKYPIEDLDVPAYRRDPSGEGKVVDMSPNTAHANKPVQNPTGDMPLCPIPRKTTIPMDCFGSLLMVWCFLSIFARPLDLSPFTIDDFENALYHDSSAIKARLLIESNVALLNAIIYQQHKTKSQGTPAVNLALYDEYHLRASTPIEESQKEISTVASPSSNDDNKSELSEFEEHITPSRRASLMERGCGSEAVAKVGMQWNSKSIPLTEDRKGWEDVLIGCINQLAPLDKVPEFDRILNLLVPCPDSTLGEREKAYIALSIKDKIAIFELLVQCVNECTFIKEYMEECQDQLTELRKQKIELSKERKRISLARVDYERRTGESSEATHGKLHTVDPSDSENSDSEDDVPHAPSQPLTKKSSIHESRQAILKRRQTQREAHENKRIKLHHRQREEAKARQLEQKARSDERKKLDEDERLLYKKEEQVERDLRKFCTLRIKSLGRDKFYNRYYYLDHIGGGISHGTGRLYVQSPSDTDKLLLLERNHPSMDKHHTLPCGRGGGIDFVSQLMRKQGLEKECELLTQSLESMSSLGSDTQEWWWVYQEPEELENLLEWLNPKGIRESKLKRELEKHVYSLTIGMKKRYNVSYFMLWIVFLRLDIILT
ncbi:ATP-utilizing chromatin assembly and remodelling N-terminal-domain-containing protein [Spinellus fusiger]|nr:ATP-utilizing chromatin assembly and remodelling N-terminal-domain-containing protein [Spinellus fusiger]